MMQSWKLLGSHTLLAAALAAAPALAQNTDVRQTDSQKIDEIQKALKDLKTEIGDLKNRLAPIEGLQKSIDNLPTNLTFGAEVLKTPLSELKEQISQLKTEIQGLRDRLRDGSRVSGFGPPDPGNAPAMGRVEMVNNYDRDMHIMLNGRSYWLMRNERRIEPVPAGSFRYEVFGATEPRVRSIAANETFTINVFPQAF
jgi:hypothetical protein